MVTSAKRNNQELIAVILKSEGYDLYSDIHKLLNYGFDNLKVIISNKNQFVDNIPLMMVYPLVAGITRRLNSKYT